LEGVPVRPAGEAPDRRLDPIDLRGVFEKLTVDVLDDVGARRSGARVTLRNPEAPERQFSRVTVVGRAEFLTRAGPHDIDVALDGFRSVQLAGAYGDQIVRLRAGIPVRVMLTGDGVPRGRIAMALLDSQRGLSLGGMTIFDEPMQATLVVTTPGRYEVAWYLQSSRNQRYLGAAPVRWVDIRDRDEVQELVLDVPEEVLAAIR